METVTYPYTGRHSVKNNDQARTRAKRQFGKDVLIWRICWEHRDGDTLCVVEYLSPTEAAAYDRAPNARMSVQRNGCTAADVHNALLEMGGTATVRDIALALDVDVQWLTKQMEHPQWQVEVVSGTAPSDSADSADTPDSADLPDFAGELTELTLDPTTAVYLRTDQPSRRKLRTAPGVVLAAVARSMTRVS